MSIMRNPNDLTSLKVQEEPPVTEVKVGVVSVLLHKLKEFRVKNLQNKGGKNHFQESVTTQSLLKEWVSCGRT